MKWPVFLLALLCEGAHGTTFHQRCIELQRQSSVSVTSRQQGYSINNTLSYQALTDMQPGKHKHSYVLGLTHTESRIAFGIDGPMLQDPAAQLECVAPHITAAVYYEPIVMYVGREFRPGSCAYAEILAHEMRHLNTYLAHLPKVEGQLRAALQHRFQRAPLLASLGQTKSLLTGEIDQFWMPIMKAEMEKVEYQQAQIDSADEYARLSKVCQGEVQSILKPRAAQTK